MLTTEELTEVEEDYKLIITQLGGMFLCIIYTKTGIEYVNIGHSCKDLNFLACKMHQTTTTYKIYAYGIIYLFQVLHL
jgi:hypothetical protein